ncbi:MAG: glycoside hydrolase family 92 protein [Chloroflexi bacterium]|nr:glycoside hydrolase family 92 protein [Chloroflexota bacterium]
MRIVYWVCAIALIAVSCGGDQAPVETPPERPLISYVNPFIGTANDGNTFPGAVGPWGMVSVSPHNVISTPGSYLEGKSIAPSGYLHDQPQMFGFGLTHLSGVGCPDLGAPVIAATTGDVKPERESYASGYENEAATPGYYAVDLTDHGIRLEATASTRAAIIRMHFADGTETGNVLIDVGDNISWGRGTGSVSVVSPTEVEGYSQTGLFCFQSNRQRTYFHARFNRSAFRIGTWADGTVSESLETSGKTGAWLSFDSPDAAPIEVRIGISYVSAANARENLIAEIGEAGFDDIRARTEASWEGLLSLVRVTGGTDDERTIFYTALYHTLLHPNVFSDVNGEYPLMGGGGNGVAQQYTRYTVFSTWDTYRTVHPLLTLVYPERQLDMVRSIAGMAQESGQTPKWEIMGNEVNLMVGDPALPIVADTYLKGLRDFAVEDLYAVMRSGAFDEPAADPPHRAGGPSYRRLGYIPMEEADTVWGPVSTTLEYAYADWALAELARALDYRADEDRLRKQALGYRTLFDPSTGLLRPRNADGSWYEPFDPDALVGSRPYTNSGGPGYVEGTAWQYAFCAPHDSAGLAALHGGNDQFVARLQAIFDEGRFEMWNEPDIAYPYLFAHSKGEAWRTQKETRNAMRENFGTGPDGLPGNDDAGALSAWYVFSALGFYPDCPASNLYTLGTPLFDRVEIRLDPRFYRGKEIVIAARQTPDRAPYVEIVRWNGETLKESVITHAQLVAGGTLDFRTSGTPHTQP